MGSGMKNIWKIVGLIFFVLVNITHACPLCVSFSKEDKRPFFEQYEIKKSDRSNPVRPELVEAYEQPKKENREKKS